MPSMRPSPGPSAPAAVGSRPEMQRPSEAPPPERSLPDVEARTRGGFHESSYELRTGMDLLEGDWPDDTTIPGALDES